MTSVELRRKKEALIANIDSFTDKFDNLNTVLGEMNSFLTSTEDTILNNEMMNQSEKISTTINKTIQAVISKKSGIIAKIDMEIARLEELEIKARLKALEEKEKEEES